MPTRTSFNLQDAASPIIEQLIFLHDHIILVVIMILTLVGYIICTLFFNSYTDRFLLQNHKLEIFWTVTPAVILIFIALPSLRLLYLIDEVGNPQITIKAIGHQWYWSYEYSEFEGINFDSYIVPEEDLQPGEPRLLSCDNRVVVPLNVQVRILVTSADVIHSWTVPALGVKVDAIPGRLNQTRFTANRPGIFFGQCSEICGANHRFIPIALEVVILRDFALWAGQPLLLGDWK